MRKLIYILSFFSFLAYHVGSTVAQTAEPLFDTSFTIFGDPEHDYRVHLLVLDRDGDYGMRNNALLTLTQDGCFGKKSIIYDSLSISDPFEDYYIIWENFTPDNVKDMKIYSSSSARSDLHYYLYIVDTAMHTLHRVKGFEDIPNAEYDSVNNIIKSYAMSGRDYWKFYKINAKYKAVDLGYTLYEDHDEKGHKRFEKQWQALKRKNHWK